MAVVRSLTTALIFVALFYVRWIWFPFISVLLTIVTTTCISWLLACRLCKHVILTKILPRVNPLGKAVFITGCDSGFGNALAFQLNQLGFHVFASCLSDKSQGAKDLMRTASTPSRMTIIQMDVTQSDDVSRALHEVSSFLQSNSNSIDSLHALINNAGILTCGEIEWQKADSIADYQMMLDVNLLGLIRVTRTFLPLIRKSRGRIVNLTSAMARTNVHSINAYCVSKTAASKFTDGLQQELTRFDVTCINVEPWFFATPLLTNEFVRESMKQSWLQASTEVRDAYGTESYQKAAHDLVFMCTNAKNVNPDTQLVVNDLIDAVTSYEPSLNYRVIGADKSVICWIVNDFLPFDLIPTARRALHALIPAHK